MKFLKQKRNQILFFIQFVACSIVGFGLTADEVRYCHQGYFCSIDFIVFMILFCYTPIIVSIFLKCVIPLKYEYMVYLLSVIASLGLWFIALLIWIVVTVGASV